MLILLYNIHVPYSFSSTSLNHRALFQVIDLKLSTHVITSPRGRSNYILFIKLIDLTRKTEFICYKMIFLYNAGVCYKNIVIALNDNLNTVVDLFIQEDDE